MPSPHTLVIVVSDLMFQSRIREQAALLGYDVRVAETMSELADATGSGASIVVIDLHITGIDWREAIAAAKARSIRVLAFGRHAEASLLRDARLAGADRVVPRSQLVEDLPALIESLARASAPAD